MSEPREWWIWKGFIGLESGVKYPSQISDMPIKDYIHVVEHSAYDQLKAELEQAKATIDKGESLLSDCENERDELRAEVEKWKDEYQNVCKFATQYEEQAILLRAEIEELNRRSQQSASFSRGSK